MGRLIKILYTTATALFFCFSCTKSEIDTGSISSSDSPRFVAYFSEDTKTTLDEDSHLRWTSGDDISVFRSIVNEKYNFVGTEESTEALFEKENGGPEPGTRYNCNYAVYPYGSSYYSSSEGVFDIAIPSSQSYVAGTFAPKVNVMTAVSENADDNVLRFRNACGFLKLRIYGKDPISSITLRGNNNEKIAGCCTVTVEGNYPPSLVMHGDANEAIILSCGDDGVVTGATEEDAVSFLFVLAPTTFSKGITIEVTNTNGLTKSYKASTSFEVKRSVIKNMETLRFSLSGGTSFKTFGLSDVNGNRYDAYVVGGDDITVRLPYEQSDPGSNLNSLVADFTHDGSKVYVEDVEQISGETSNDFSDFINGVKYKIVSSVGDEKEYTVKAIDANLPMLFITTPDFYPVTTKEYKEETNNSEIFLINTDGSITDLGTTGIKGRGNSTWGQPKNPYNIKLDKKTKLLGMKKSKKWCLMANYYDVTLMKNSIAMEMGNRMDDLGWNPHGDYVEFVLNGKWCGNYWVCEKIEVDENRVNIAELTSSMTGEEEITGGYILEYDAHGGEEFYFTSDYFSMPVNFKDPDSDIPDVQFNYMKQYINDMEYQLSDSTRIASRRYADYLDIDSVIDWWIVTSLTGNFWEAHYPLSVYFHKDRSEKLKAGPLWDFDTAGFTESGKIDKGTVYFSALFKDPVFIQRLKDKWSTEMDYLTGAAPGYASISSYIDNLDNIIRYSALRDKAFWGNHTGDGNGYTFYVPWNKNNLTKSISKLNDSINNL